MPISAACSLPRRLLTGSSVSLRQSGGLGESRLPHGRIDPAKLDPTFRHDFTPKPPRFVRTHSPGESTFKSQFSQ